MQTVCVLYVHEKIYSGINCFACLHAQFLIVYLIKHAPAAQEKAPVESSLRRVLTAGDVSFLVKAAGSPEFCVR
jgi:hypothetical protein